MALSPAHIPFDVSDPAASAVADLLSGPAAALTVVALVVSDRTRASGWGARAGIALAESWWRGRRVVLADLDLANPALHELLGVELDEGVIDVIDYGVSLRRCLRPVRGGTFDLLAGNYSVEDPGGVLASDAWRRVLLDVATARATLLAWVPAALPGVDALIERAGAVIVLAEPAEAATVVQRLAHPYGVIAVLTPADAPAAPAAMVEAVVTAATAEPVVATARLSDEAFERIRLPTDRASREALILEMRDRQRAARRGTQEPAAHGSAARPATSGSAAVSAAAGASSPSGDVAIRGRAGTYVPAGAGEAAVELRTTVAADDVSLETIDPGARPGRRGYRTPRLWTLVIVLLASLVAGAWRYLSVWLPFLERGAATAPVTQVVPPVAPAGVPPDTLPYVVALEAHRELATALERVATLHEVEPRLSFHVAPLERENTMFYHVMAGPVRDSAAALVLRDTLIARGHKTTPTPTDVRRSPLAFLVGAHEDAAAAAAQLEELRRLDIPAYTIARADAPRYQNFVGGFVAPAEADVVRQLLRAAGIRDSLVTRTGSITP